MKLYGALFSPFVRKAALAAAEKGIALDIAGVNFADPSEGFLAASPFRKIPALVDGDFRLADSTAIATYFEALVPEPALLPADPRARARAVWFEEVADTVLVPTAGPAILNRFVLPNFRGVAGDEAAALAAVAKLAAVWDYLESQMPEAGYLVGDFSMGDVALASTLRTLVYINALPDPAGWPKMAAWYQRVCQREAWVATAAREEADWARLKAHLGVNA